MGVIGKIIGGTLGFALGGPLGAIAGAAFGHAFDRGNDTWREPQAVPLTYQHEAQVTFFVATFSILAHLARVDGQVTSREIDAVERFMAADLNLGPTERQAAMRIFHTAAQRPERVHDLAVQFHRQFFDQPQMLELLLDVLLRVAVADDRLHPAEDDLIQQVAQVFRLQERYRHLKSRHVADTAKYYAVLGCQPSDSDETIKRRYRKLLFDYHPDRIVSKGLPEEFEKFANGKLREIQEAYEAVKKERGIA